MSARDELADALVAIRFPHGSGLTLLALDGTSAEAIADTVLRSGYRKPRTITTAEELDALPNGSVILDPNGLSLHKNEFTGWRASNGAKDIPAEMLAHEALPATILHEPAATR